MKKLLFSGVAFTALAMAPALAADLPRKAPAYQPPPPPVVGWAGWYIGLNAGGIWSHGDITNNVVSSFCNTDLVGCDPDQFAVAAEGAVPLNFDNNGSGFIGGGQIGYNFQTGPIVFGIEADIQWTSLDDEHSRFGSVVPVGFPNNTVDITGTARQQIDWLGTVRGRLGWTPTPPMLLYVTGGLAYGHVETDVAFSGHVTGPCFCGPEPFTSVSFSDTRVGWTVGGGVEWMFAPRWSFKAEYLYYDLGSETLSNQLTQVSGDLVPFFGVGIASDVEYKGSIARAGVNFHF